MSVASLPTNPRWSIPALVLGSAAVIAFLVFLNPPAFHESEVRSRAEAAPEGGGELDDGTIPGLSEARIQVVPMIPTIVAVEHRANRVLELRVGPDERYLTAGQIASGARVEVVGRTEKADWLAISLTPGSRTYGWVRTAGVSGLTASNIQALPVVPVVRLP
jgi:hypothetical protein